MKFKVGDSVYKLSYTNGQVTSVINKGVISKIDNLIHVDWELMHVCSDTYNLDGKFMPEGNLAIELQAIYDSPLMKALR